MARTMDPVKTEIFNTLDKCFGKSGWSCSISNVVLDYIEENTPGNFSAGASAIVRIQLADGIFREDLGYGGSSGSMKADAISKAKKEAVTDGLMGAVCNLGSDVAGKFSHLRFQKTENVASVSSARIQINVIPPVPNPRPDCIRAPVVVKNSSDVQLPAGTSQVNSKVLVSSSSPVGMKFNPAPGPIPVVSGPPAPLKSPARVTPIPRVSPPLAVPIPPNTATNQLSEEELAKMERKRRQQQKQEEFRQKHLLAQAQASAQSKTQQKQPVVQQSRTPLKEQQPQQSNNHPNENGNGANTLDGDDDVLLSTQDMEAVVQIAAINTGTNTSKRAPIISSPSIARPSEVKPNHGRLSMGHKRPDLSNFAHNPEKKPRGMQ